MNTKTKVLIGVISAVAILLFGAVCFLLGSYRQLKANVDSRQEVLVESSEPEETAEVTEHQEVSNEGKQEEQGEQEMPEQTSSNAVYEPVYGALSVKGTKLVDKTGHPVQLKGVSTHGLQWYPEYVNEDAIKTLHEDWKANVLRLAMYTNEGGYCSGADKEQLEEVIDQGVKLTGENKMYCIIDWHILSDCHPVQYQNEAKDFFGRMSAKYKDCDHVIYEICNEPNSGANWDEIKSYADDVIPAIRANDKDAIILVGTPTWSQDVDEVAKNPLANGDNVMYVCHFYAATHKDDLRRKVEKALDAGTPIFVSEFSICDASGNGGLDYDSAAKWMELLNENNISYVGWNLANKQESSSMIRPDCTKTSGWSEGELNESGQWMRRTMRGE
ncbi:MAG: cellulase family glycosylhydrolase [Lachnospiraceae bacterium]|nr:cellulase family glycosylhydrolase [Lachnospiraceae bacterium]